MDIQTEPLRVLYSREHTTIFPKLGVFLAGPTPPNGDMRKGWRRKVIEKLKEDPRLNPNMTVVAPEPETGNWADIEIKEQAPQLTNALNKQIPWEWQYLNLCDITAFWLPTYWASEQAEYFPPNIGPTSRWEFGFYLQEYLKHPNKRHFIVGGPADAESAKWAKRITAVHGIKWHSLPSENKPELVAASFIDEIADTLYENQLNLA